MELKQINAIENNIVSTRISVESLGTALMDAAEEKELLEDTIVNLEYSAITFSDFVKVTGGNPVIVPSTDPAAEEVTLSLINKIIKLDENFEVELSIDITKIPTSALTAQLTTPLLVAQAQILIFTTKIKDEVERLLTEMRNAHNDFEGETLYTI